MTANKAPDHIFLDRFNLLVDKAQRNPDTGIDIIREGVLEEFRKLARGEGEYGIYLRALRRRRERDKTGIVARSKVDLMAVGDTVELPHSIDRTKIGAARVSISRFATTSGRVFSVKLGRGNDGFAHYYVERLA